MFLPLDVTLQNKIVINCRTGNTLLTDSSEANRPGQRCNKGIYRPERTKNCRLPKFSVINFCRIYAVGRLFSIGPFLLKKFLKKKEAYELRLNSLFQGCGSSRIFFDSASSLLGFFCFRFRIKLVAFEFASFRILPLPPFSK